MKYQAENAVSSFFYYMWNAWSKEECEIVFGNMYRHFWDKWSSLSDKGIFGAAERFFSELSEKYQKLLVERAVALYDGRAFRKEPDDEDIYVCEVCGSTSVECTAWVDANTNEYVSDSDDGEWCCECEEHSTLLTLKEFKERMQSWWNQCEVRVMEQITELKECDYPSGDGSRTFVEATTQWWNNQDYEHKREIYKKHNSKNE